MSDLAQKSLKEQEQELQQKDIRYEVYEGVIYAMAPPSSDHQIIQYGLTRQLDDFFKGKKCQTFAAPFGVNLTEFTESKKKTSFQPDISVVCDPHKLDRRTGTYYGSPTLIVEIGSPSTIDKDITEKKDLYEKAGVLEYLLVLDRYTANLYTLKDGTYQKTLSEADETGNLSIPIPSFSELTLEIRDDWFWFGR
jgi:Uma2 family endonuclease